MARYGDAWKVRVAAAPERGKANEAVVTLLADALEVPNANVELLAGLGSRDKVAVVRGLSGSAAEARLDAVAAARGGAR